MLFFNSIRELGRFQTLVLCFFCLNLLAASFNNYAILLNAPEQEHWCTDLSPGFQNLTSEKQKSLMRKCERPNLDFANYSNEDFIYFNVTQANWTKCSEFSYSHDQFLWTLTEKFDLVCDKKWWATQGPSVYMFGYLCAGFSSGILCDKLGRKTLIVASSIFGVALNIASMFPPNMYYYYAIRFVLAIVDTYVWLPGLVLLTELVDKDQRNFIKLIDSIMFDVLSMLIGALALLYSHFQFLHAVNAVLYLMTLIIAYFFLCESPRWLTVKERSVQAQKVVDRIAKWNRVPIARLRYLLRAPDKSGQGSVFSLFRTPVIRKRTIIQFLLWICTIFITYSIIYNLGSFSSDIRLGLIISGAIGVPSLVPCMMVVNHVGRQLTMFILFVLCSVCSFAMIPLASDRDSILLFLLALAGKFAINGAFCIIWLLTQELYPTCIRTTGVGACSTVGRLGALLAVQTIMLNDLWNPATVVAMGTVAALAAILLPALPDTTGIDLPQTIADGEELSAKHRYQLILPSKTKSRDVQSTDAVGELDEHLEPPLLDGNATEIDSDSKEINLLSETNAISNGQSNHV